MGNKIIYKGHSIGETTQVSIMPTATADNSGAIVQYVGATNANYINGYFYKCVSDGGVTPAYSWEKVQVSDGGDTIQVETLPTASASEVGNIYEFVGTTTANYINGRFYRCVSDGASTPTYTWEEVDLGDGTPHWSGTRAEYEAQKDSIPEGAYVALTDDIDSTYESGDYSLNEVNTGKRWIDGKPIYRKVFTDIPLPEESDISQTAGVTAIATTTIFPAHYIDNIVNASFVILNTIYNHQFSLPRRWNNVDTSTEQPLVIEIDANVAFKDNTFETVIETRSNRTAWSNTSHKVRAIIEYTKND